jgi:hypothetical protein
MKKLNIILGKTHRRILRLLLEGILDKAGVGSENAYFFVRFKDGIPVNPTTLVMRDKDEEIGQ